MGLRSQPTPTPQELIERKPWAPGSTQAWLPSIVGTMCDRRIPAQAAYDAICGAFPDDEQYQKRCRESARMVKRKYGGKLNTETVKTSNNWPELDVAETVPTVDQQEAINLASYANSARSRTGEFTTFEILQRLFFPDALLCVGESFSKAEIRPLKSLRSLDLSRFEFIVPTQATKRVGKNQDGADSVRCLDTIGERRFLVIEFDFSPEKDGKPTIWADPINHWLGHGWTPKDASARLLNHLSGQFKREPVLIVDSGNKSIHGWYWFRDESEAVAREFMAYAASLGADPAVFVRCQWVRSPGGTLADGRKQPVTYFRSDLLGAYKRNEPRN